MGMMLENNRLSTNLPMGPGSEETGFFTVSGSGPSFLSDEQALRFATIGQPIDDPTLCIVGEEALEAAQRCSNTILRWRCFGNVYHRNFQLHVHPKQQLHQPRTKG